MKFFAYFLTTALMLGLPASAEVPTPSADLMTMTQDARCRQVLVTCLVGGEPLRMLLDTGASHTVLHKDSAAKLKNVHRPDISMIQFKGNARQRPELLTGTLQAGALTLPEHTCLVMDLTPVRAAMATPPDGILGMDVLGIQPFTFDQRNSTFYWGLPKKAQGVQMNGRPDRFGRLIVEAECRGKKLELLLDSGSTVTRMPADLWPAGVEKTTSVHVGDVNCDTHVQVQLGKPADLAVAPGVVLSAVQPVLTPGQPPILGMDSLRGVALVHVPVKGSSCGVFYVVK